MHGLHPRHLKTSWWRSGLLSRAEPPLALDAGERAQLTQRIQNGGTEVVEAKAGAGSATLSMAYAAARFAESCLRALRGEGGVVECAYVASAAVPGLEFFASPVIGSVEVFEAKIAEGLMCASIASVTVFLTSRSSNTASMTRSASARSA